MVKKLVILLMAALFAFSALADTVRLRDDHPDRYVVVKGDTLWDISARFLKDPWLWPEIWEINPAIKNPHLIYPGDVISLTYDADGKPHLKLTRGRPVVKLSPRMRATPIREAIPTIPLDAIRQFLLYPRVVSAEALEKAGYIVAQDEGSLISASGDKVYVRGLRPEDGRDYYVTRIGDAYRNPGAKRKEILGYEALQIADAKVLRFGDPSTVRLGRTSREVLIGDRLFPIVEEEKLEPYFLPHAPDFEIEGQIISVLDGVSRIGQYHTVVLNKGSRDGLERGHVLLIRQRGESARDTVAPRRHGRRVQLPSERAGAVMVVRVFDRVSYALVMEANRDMRVLDMFTSPGT
ncbi:MAG TPA: LysM peptidoglycan-binding domain-containing protein [Gammaproteobacteria bacterium]|nr:LysM peptidoglycan-binding domain-containing protein [Gammaproteobacteria bacterium]